MRRTSSVAAGPYSGRAAGCRCLIAAIAAVIACATLEAVLPEQGVPFVSHAQNWAIVQDAARLMCFGNTDGVLEFDGVRWSLIPVANGSARTSSPAHIPRLLRAWSRL